MSRLGLGLGLTAAMGSWRAAPTPPFTPVLWLDATAGRYDATSGGNLVTANRGQIKRWEDQSGNANHVTQATTANCCRYDATRHLVVSEMSDGTTAVGEDEWFTLPSIPINRRAFSAFFVLDWGNLRRPATLSANHYLINLGDFDSVLYLIGSTGAGTQNGRLNVFNGAAQVTSGLIPSHNRCLIGIVGDATECRVYLNGTKVSLAPLPAGTSTGGTLFGVSSQTVPLEGSVRDGLLYDRALTDGEVTGTLMTFAASRGVRTSFTKSVWCTGDSITHGFLQTLNGCWPRLVAEANPTWRVRNTAEASITLQTLAGEVASWEGGMIAPGDVVVIFAGTNDVQAGRSSAQVIADLRTYADAITVAGGLIVPVTMLPRDIFSGAQNVIRAAVNAEITTDPGNHYAGRKVDLTGVEGTINRPDGTHPDDAGAATIAGAAATVIGGL